MTAVLGLGLGSLVALSAAGLLYLALAPASPRRLPVKAALCFFALLTCVAALLCSLWLGVAESIYFVLMVLTIALSALPFLTLLLDQKG